MQDVEKNYSADSAPKDSYTANNKDRDYWEEEEKDLLTWQAPVRPFKRRGKEFFTTVLAVALLVSVIMFTIGEKFAIVVIAALVFLVYVLSLVPPEEVGHKITNRGIFFAGKKYYWQDLTRFWFDQKVGNTVLAIEMFALPGKIELVIDQEDQETIKRILNRYLRFDQAAPNLLDKTAKWFSKRIPLEG